MNIRMLHNPAVIKVEAAFFLALIKVYYWKPAMVLHNDRCRHLFISPISSVVAPHIYLFQERTGYAQPSNSSICIRLCGIV